jgi:spore coat protein U-like protein
MKIRTILAIFLVWIGGSGLFAFGSIEMTSPEPIAEGYLSGAGIEVGRSVTLTVGGGGGGIDRTYRIGFSPGASGDPQNRTLVGAAGTISYELIDNVVDENKLTDLDDGGVVLSGTIPASSSATESFVVRVATGYLPAAGVYTDDVTITAYDFQSRVQSQTTLSILVEVVPQLRLTLSTNDLDLGELSEGATGGVTLRVEATTDYGLEFSSRYNDWRMAHEEETVSSYVPYSLRLDGEEQGMAQNPIFRGGFSQTTPAGREHLLEIIVGSIDGAVSGPHADVIDITVTANQ